MLSNQLLQIQINELSGELEDATTQMVNSD